MSEPSACLGHGIRSARKNKIGKFSNSPYKDNLDVDKVVLIKKGPESVDTSLKKLVEDYASKPGWTVIEGGGVLSVPVEEFRIINPPKPDRLKKRKGKVLDLLS